MAAPIRLAGLASGSSGREADEGRWPTDGRYSVQKLWKLKGDRVSNVIHFLEKMGGSAVMARMSEAEFRLMVEALDTDAESRDAICRRDSYGLNALLGGSDIMFCCVQAPCPDDQEDQVPEEEEDPERRED